MEKFPLITVSGEVVTLSLNPNCIYSWLLNQREGILALTRPGLSQTWPSNKQPLGDLEYLREIHNEFPSLTLL